MSLHIDSNLEELLRQEAALRGVSVSDVRHRLTDSVNKLPADVKKMLWEDARRNGIEPEERIVEHIIVLHNAYRTALSLLGTEKVSDEAFARFVRNSEQSKHIPPDASDTNAPASLQADPDMRTPEQRAQEFLEWAESHEEVSEGLPEEALRRESIY